MTSKDYLKQIAESKGVFPLTNDISSKYKTPILQRILLEKEMSNKDISTAINSIYYEINARIIKEVLEK